jgi:hypothetical protein
MLFTADGILYMVAHIELQSTQWASENDLVNCDWIVPLLAILVKSALNETIAEDSISFDSSLNFWEPPST